MYFDIQSFSHQKEDETIYLSKLLSKLRGKTFWVMTSLFVSVFNTLFLYSLYSGICTVKSYFGPFPSKNHVFSATICFRVDEGLFCFLLFSEMWTFCAVHLSFMSECHIWIVISCTLICKIFSHIWEKGSWIFKMNHCCLRKTSTWNKEVKRK